MKTIFLEFDLGGGTTILVNVAMIMNVFITKEGKAQIVQSGDEVYTVNHKYESVLEAIRNAGFSVIDIKSNSILSPTHKIEA